MRKSFKFKLFNNKKKAKILSHELWQFHLIYNHSLALIKGHYKLFGKNPHKVALQKHLKKLMDKGLKPEWKELGYSQGIQEVTDRIYLSYQAFFQWAKKRSGARKSPPKFRPFRKYKSFTLKQAGWKLDEDAGKIKIGANWYRYNNSRKVAGVVKTVTVKRDSVGDWFIVLSCDLGDTFKPDKIAPVTGKSAGFDFGLKTFLVSSEGDEIESPQFLKQSLSNLRSISKNLSKKVKGSKNRKKARKNLARLQRRIVNKRQDFQFKLALDLVRKYDVLYFEDLCLSGMKALWGRKVSDLSIDSLIQILEFKASEHYKSLYKINRFFPSSKLCSRCGSLKDNTELKLKDRVYKCDCGFEMDRDLNAAINIKKEGVSSLGVGRVRLGLGLASAV